MGLYDTVQVPGYKPCQVKCWDRAMQDRTIGDQVPGVGGFQSYSIALREYVDDAGLPRKFLNVTRYQIAGITSTPKHRAKFDKWGNPLGGQVSDAVRAFPFYVHGLAENE